MDNVELAIRKVMQSNEIDEFVQIEDGLLSDTDKTEILSEVIDSKTTEPIRVDLIKMAHLHIQGFSRIDIAKEFSVTVDNINYLRGTEKYRAILGLLNNEIVATARTFLTASSMKAVLTLITMLNSRDDRIKLKAATEIMDRIGLKTPEQIEIIQKGDKLAQMSETELLEFVKSGVKEIKIPDAGVLDGTNKLQIT